MGVVAYHIWLRRNRFVFEGVIGNTTCLLKGVYEALEDYRLPQCQEQRIVTQQSDQRSVPWSAPLSGQIKINWDAALDRHHNLMGVGLLARDHLGRVVAAMCFSQKYQLDPSTAEAFGVQLAAEFARFQGFTSISLEGDAQEVVRAMHRDDEGRYPFGSLIFDAKEILKSFISWDIGYVPRGINGAAHRLAKLACS
jgi:ribonuclease HI